MTHSRRRLAFSVLLGSALILALPACDSDQPRVLLTRASPAPTPSTARIVPTAVPTAAPAMPTATLPPSPAPSPTRTPTPRPTASPTTAPGLPVTPVQAPPTQTPGSAVTPVRVPPTPVPTAAPTATPLRVHIVRYGETLAIIARQYGTTVTAIARLNNLANINRIYPGQRLLIP